MTDAPVLAVAGLKREAELLRSPGVIPVIGGGDSVGLARKLQAAITERRPRGVVSLGLGGALSPALQVGDWVVGEAVVCGGERWTTDAGWTLELQTSLAAIFSSPAKREEETSGAGGGSAARRQAEAPPPSASPPRLGGKLGRIAAGNVIVTDGAAKAELYAATGALAVDMESHVAARAAAAHRLPFAALRVISDGAGDALPPAVQVCMTPDGGVNVAAMLASLARDPRQLPALIRTGRQAQLAFRRLRLLRRHNLLGRLGIGDADLGQLTLDVV